MVHDWAQYCKTLFVISKDFLDYLLVAHSCSKDLKRKSKCNSILLYWFKITLPDVFTRKNEPASDQSI